MKWMAMREFLRGGYKTIREPTVISKYGAVEFTVIPSNWTNQSVQNREVGTSQIATPVIGSVRRP